jgi:hypothetical protein
MDSRQLPPGTRVERHPPWLQVPAGCETAVLHRGVLYVSDVQMIRLDMGDPVTCLNLDEFEAKILSEPLPMTTRPTL